MCFAISQAEAAAVNYGPADACAVSERCTVWTGVVGAAKNKIVKSDNTQVG